MGGGDLTPAVRKQSEESGAVKVSTDDRNTAVNLNLNKIELVDGVTDLGCYVVPRIAHFGED